MRKKEPRRGLGTMTHRQNCKDMVHLFFAKAIVV